MLASRNDSLLTVHGSWEILAELREQYAIGYYPEPRERDGTWRTVEVDVGRRGVHPRWRSEYFDR